MQNKSSFVYIPIICSICVVIGLFLGKTLYQNANNTLNFDQFNFSGNGKIDDLLEKINENYVDTINARELSDYAINQMLEKLDPHSQYIPIEYVQETEEELNGNFDGIGIEFRIYQDTLYVVHPIKDGPSKQAGLMAGDRIIAVNDSTIYKKDLNADDVVPLLKGPKGSNVKVTVYRPSAKSKTLEFNITRGEIPIKSVDVSLVVKNQIGYIKINRFSHKTVTEFTEAVDKLYDQNIEKLIIDVRDNPGGLLNAVVDILDQLLEKNQMILYTKGRNENQQYYSTIDGKYKDIPLVVLVDENSASASEILAGALQDNDRATIIGRRTFGKGLVQSTFPLTDQSMARITIARYYTPSGRCIQKPYHQNNEDYQDEMLERWKSGELFSEDSLKQIDTTIYKTKKGKIVYGGGGISPDIFIPLDSTYQTQLLRNLFKEDIIKGFIVQQQLGKPIKGNNVKESLEILKKSELMQQFKAYAIQKGIKWDNNEYENSKNFISNYIFGQLLKQKYEEIGLLIPTLTSDQAIQSAIEFLEK